MHVIFTINYYLYRTPFLPVFFCFHSLTGQKSLSYYFLSLVLSVFASFVSSYAICNFHLEFQKKQWENYVHPGDFYISPKSWKITRTHENYPHENYVHGTVCYFISAEKKIPSFCLFIIFWPFFLVLINFSFKTSFFKGHP